MESGLQMPPLGPSLLFALASVATMIGVVVIAGHFPRAQRRTAMRALTGEGAVLAVVVATLLAFGGAVLIAVQVLPWYAAVILGGLAILAGPLLEQHLPLGLRATPPGVAVMAIVQAVLAWACANVTGIIS